MTDLAFSDFNINNIEVHNLIFADGYVVDYSKLGRKQHLLHLMLSGKRTYYINDEEIELEGQNALFIPHGTIYSTKSYNLNGTECSGIGVSFDATTKNGKILLFPHGIYQKNCGDRTRALFLEIDKVYKHVEEILLREVCRRSCAEVAWRHDGTATIFTTYNTHIRT